MKSVAGRVRRLFLRRDTTHSGAKAPAAPANSKKPSTTRDDLDDAIDDAVASLEELENMIVRPSRAEAEKAPAPRRAEQTTPTPVRAMATAKTTPEAKATPAAASGRTRRPLTPEREALLRDALRVTREKQVVLAELSREDRERLTVLAYKTLIDKNFGEDKE